MKFVQAYIKNFDFLKKKWEGVVGITNRIKTKNFSGYEGLVIKNSIYQFSTSFITKVGSLVLSVILARLLLPELFGLYSLALGTILFFSGFADLGISQTLIRYVSKKQRLSKGYIKYLGKLKLFITSLTALILLFSAKWISNNYYHKPIFLVLMIGSLYIMLNSLLGFLNNLFQADNNFRRLFFSEIIFQIMRVILLPIIILFISFSSESLIFIIIFFLAICHIFPTFFLFVNIKKYSGKDLSRKQKKEVNKFILPLSISVLLGLFFNYVSIFMLGAFVSSEFIGYYQIAYSLASSFSFLILFYTVLLPIFSRIKGVQLKRGLRKSILITFMFSILAMIVVIIIAKPAILILYGGAYCPSIVLLRVLSLILITDPLIGILNSYLLSKGKTKKITITATLSIIVNILLNYLSIIFLIKISMYAIILGIAISTVISKVFYILLIRRGE